MKKILPTMIIILVFVASIITYKVFNYTTGFRSEVSRTEDELKKAQGAVIASLRELALESPRFKKLVSSFGGLEENGLMSPEHLSMLATTLEMWERFEGKTPQQDSNGDLSTGFSQLMQGIEQLKKLEKKDKSRTRESGSTENRLKR